MKLPGQVYELDLFFESWEFFGTAAMAGTLAGMLLGMLGVYVVLRRMVFLSAGLSQASSFGVAYAFFLQAEWQVYTLGEGEHGEHSHTSNYDGVWGAFLELITEPLVVSSAFALGVALMMQVVAKRPNRNTESALGFIYLAGSAGTIALAPFIVQEVQDIQSLLLGNAVVVVEDDYHHIMGLTVIMGLLHLVGMRGFIQASFDPDGARIRGLPVGALELVLLASIAFSVANCTRILGALPVFAFSVLPAMAAVRLSASVPWALLIAGLVGAASGFGGYVVAFLFQLSVGASQTLCAAGLVAVVVVGRLVVEKVAQRRARDAAH